MRTRLYSTSRPDFKPIIFTEEELTHPTLPTLQLLLNSISPPGLTFGGFIVAATLWIISACEAIQITCLGYLLSALSEPVDTQPLPPKWLFPVENFSLSSSQTAILSSAVYLGMLIGGLLSSPLEKYNGSRPALLLCCISSLLAYFGSAEAPNFLTLTICQTIGGLSFGARVAVVYSNLAQLFPNHQIGFVVTTASFVWVLGSMYASIVGYLTLGSIFGQSWRVYMLLLTIPSILALLLAFFFAYETIHFGVYKQFRPNPAIDLLKIHHGKVLSRSCKHFWYNIFCCCGAGCCGKHMGSNKYSRSLTNRYGTIDDAMYQDDTQSVTDSQYSYDPPHFNNNSHNSQTGLSSNNEYSSNLSNRYTLGQQDNQLLFHYKPNQIDPLDPNNDPYSQQYERQRKPSMFPNDNQSGLAGTPTQGKTFDHEQYLTDDFKQLLMNGGKPIEFTSANTVYTDTGSRANSLPDTSYVGQAGLGGDEDILNGHSLVNYVQSSQLTILDDHYLTSEYNPSSRNKTDIFTATELDQRDMSALGLTLINLHSSKTDGSADWNIDIDNSASIEELFDFLHKQLAYYTATLQYNKKHNINEEQCVGSLSPDHTRITNDSPSGLNQTNSSSHATQFNDNTQSSTLLMSLQSDLSELQGYSDLSQSSSSSLNELATSKTKAMAALSRTQQLFLLVILCAVWFIVSFQAAGFWSFLPLLWDRVFPNQSDDMKYIVSLIFSAVQLPAGLINMIIISRVFPPRLLLASSLISFFAMCVVTAVFKSELTVATIFVFVCQFGLSTAWCAINYVALQYFPDDKKILYFAVQASVGKFGAFVAQYVFALLLEKNSFLLMLVVTILSGISVLFCFWFNYTVRNAITTH